MRAFNILHFFLLLLLLLLFKYFIPSFIYTYIYIYYTRFCSWCRREGGLYFDFRNNISRAVRKRKILVYFTHYPRASKSESHVNLLRKSKKNNDKNYIAYVSRRAAFRRRVIMTALSRHLSFRRVHGKTTHSSRPHIFILFYFTFFFFLNPNYRRVRLYRYIIKIRSRHILDNNHPPRPPRPPQK